ncbi:hypothetical protein [Rhodohalobacter barkolensis]|uniref:Uncharacterized protein n=1 Tax=Rhodohalobacter barkolensis TaxID=2053187 RepID=A0A2N0VEJ1_9BACT|nr:hypothetical protein [Rhodohalobacter barkolensis]PKD42609.1 hypothetical protein CWD77_14465 [Rhodohalobacter barkolensis]
MIKLLFIVVVVTSSGILNSATARQSETHVSLDSTAVFQQWMESLPDSVKVSVPADSLKSYFNNCVDNWFNMPTFEPDPNLTASMPQLEPPKVDEKMILPQFKNCPDRTQPPKK